MSLLTPDRPLAGSLEVTVEDAALLSRLARDRGGLDLAPGKTEFFRTRLARLAREHRLTRARDLIATLGTDGEGGQRLVEALTTHTTSFFREKRHFDWLACDGLALVAALPRPAGLPLTIWSAACSSGAELWSAGMVCLEATGGRAAAPPFRLIGSDLSARILRVASGATYDANDVAGISADRLAAFFLRSRTNHQARGRLFRIVPALRDRAEFHQVNLTAIPPDFRPAADMIFLRNVLIYFDAPTRHAVAAAVVARLRPGGVLLIGHSEQIDGRSLGLEQLAPALFRKPVP